MILRKMKNRLHILEQLPKLLGSRTVKSRLNLEHFQPFQLPHLNRVESDLELLNYQRLSSL